MWNPFGLFFDDYSGPQVHAYEGAEGLLLEMEVPRYREDEITVAADAATGRLVIRGERKQPHQHGDIYDRLLFADTASTRFKQSLRVSPEYDLSKLTRSLADGVLSINVPRKPVEVAAPLRIEGQQQQQADATALTTAAAEGTVALQAKQAMSTMRWPPKVKADDNAQALTYTCELPKELPRENIHLELRGRNITLSTNYTYRRKTDTSEEAQSATYATTLPVPQGTKPEDVHTHLENGVLTVSMEKHPSASEASRIPVK